MNEWTVITVLAALAGLGVAVVTPIVRLNTTITKLAAIVEATKDNLLQMAGRNTRSHERLWDKNMEQDKLLDEHEKRITKVEERTR